MGTLRLPAVHLDPFAILHEPIPSCRPWFAPLGRGRPTGGQGVVGSGLPIRIDDGNVGVSQVPWKPWWSLSVLFDPGRIRQAEWTKSKLPDTAPACLHDEGSRRLVLSGLNHTTFDLTVYASQDGSPYHHARLASGCWSSFARREADEPRPGSGGKVTLWADDEQIGEGTMPRTVSMLYTTYAGMDIGRDNGGVVDLDYEDKAPYAFTGTIKNVVFDLKPATHEDEKALHEHHSRESVAAGVAGEHQAATTQIGIRCRIPAPCPCRKPHPPGGSSYSVSADAV